MSDGWSAYSGISDLPEEYEHEVVNHSEEFINSDGFHTNNIEAMWNVVKSKIPVRKRNKKYLQLHLYKRMWREHNIARTWECLIHAIQIGVYDDLTSFDIQAI